MNATKGLVVPAGGGAHLDMSAPGCFAAVKLFGHETNESIMLFEEPVPAGREESVPLHRDSDEVAWVLAGDIAAADRRRGQRRRARRLRVPAAQRPAAGRCSRGSSPFYSRCLVASRLSTRAAAWEDSRRGGAPSKQRPSRPAKEFPALSSPIEPCTSPRWDSPYATSCLARGASSDLSALAGYRAADTLIAAARMGFAHSGVCVDAHERTILPRRRSGGGAAARGRCRRPGRPRRCCRRREAPSASAEGE